MNQTKTWTLYIIRCADGSLYTGITVDLERRFKEHQAVGEGIGTKKGASKGAKYLRGRGPLQLIYSTAVESHSVALKLEYKIKKLSRLKKEAIVSGRFSPVQLLQEPAET